MKWRNGLFALMAASVLMSSGSFVFGGDRPQERIHSREQIHERLNQVEQTGERGIKRAQERVQEQVHAAGNSMEQARERSQFQERKQIQERLRIDPQAEGIQAGREERIRTQERVYGWQLMSEEELVEHRAKMGSLGTEKEREEYRLEHHNMMQERARAKGVALSSKPAAGGSGNGQGQGEGGSQGSTGKK